MKARAFSPRDSLNALQTSTRSTSPATAFPPIAAGPCGTPTRSGFRRSTNAFSSFNVDMASTGQQLHCLNSSRTMDRLSPPSMQPMNRRSRGRGNKVSYLILAAGIHTIGQKKYQPSCGSVMKKFKALSVPGLIVMICISLFAQEPQGRGGGAPPGGAAGGRGGQRGGGGRGGRGTATPAPRRPTGPVVDATDAIIAAINSQDAAFFRLGYHRNDSGRN